jgi:hypothetical protein
MKDEELEGLIIKIDMKMAQKGQDLSADKEKLCGHCYRTRGKNDFKRKICSKFWCACEIA